MPAGWIQRLHKRPLGISQIARVTKVIAVCRTAVFQASTSGAPKRIKRQTKRMFVRVTRSERGAGMRIKSRHWSPDR
jgi:hypothetical protein